MARGCGMSGMARSGALNEVIRVCRVIDGIGMLMARELMVYR